MNHRDIAAMMAGIAPVVRDFVAEGIKGFGDRLAALERRAPEKGEPGAHGRDGIDGKNGASVVVSDLAPLVAEEVGKAVGALPAAKDGADGKPGLDGKDGASVAVSDLAPLVAEEVGKAVGALPAAKDGADGKPGLDGKDGAPGRDGVDGKDAPVTRDDILAAIKGDPSIIAEAVAAYLKENPPTAGRDGKDAAAVTPEMLVTTLLPAAEGAYSPLKQAIAEYYAAFPPPAGRDGQPGVPGRDGKDGINGKDGAPGSDGLGFDDLHVEHDGERTLKVVFVKGEAKKEFEVDVPAVIDRGVWRDGAFKAGDGVSWDGSWFVAQKDTDKRPGTPDSGWRLAAKRGRDGASAFDVAKRAGFKGDEAKWMESLRGKPGEPGKSGRDLTQMTYSGDKY